MALNFEILDTYHTWLCNKTFTAATSDIITSATHGLADDDIIRVYSGTTLPAPLLAEVCYYVKRIDDNTFYLSLTAGGANINITNTGTGVHRLYRSADHRMFTVDAGTNIFTSVAHGLIEGEDIRVYSNSAIPSPLVDSTRYYVKYIGVDTFKLAVAVGGDEIDITTTGTGSHWFQRPQARNIINVGTLLTNLTRAGEALITSETRNGFQMGDLIGISFLIISGDFQALDECVTSEGGFLSLYGAATVATDDTIVIDGIDDSDTTANLNGTINASVTTIVHTSYAGISALRYIRIDSEWMFVLNSDSATNLTVKRAMFGTTAASHTTGADIYILAEDLPRAIIDEDAAQGWGLCSMASGKFEINAPVVLGRPDQTGQTLLLTQLDCVRFTDLYIAGETTYGTTVQSGVGWVDAGEGEYQGLYFNGSNIIFTNFDQFKNSTLNLYGGSTFNNEGNQIHRGGMNVMTASMNAINYSAFVLFSNKQACKVYRCWINNQRVSATSEFLDWNSVWINFKIYQEPVYFLLGGGDATFKNMEMVDSQFDGGIFGFAAGGTKTFIDCDINETTNQFLASIATIFKKTINISTFSAGGIAIGNERIKIFDKNLTVVVDTLTDATGNMDEQSIIYKYLDVDGTTMVDNNPFKIVVHKRGRKNKNFKTDVYEKKIYEFVIDVPETEEEET